MQPSCLLNNLLRRSARFAIAVAAASSSAAPSEQIIRFDGVRDDQPAAITTDASGAILIAARSDSLTQPTSFVVVKQTPAGATQWTARYQATPDQTLGSATSVAADGAGNVYAVGTVGRPVGLLQINWDALVVSFDANGNQRWAHAYNGPANGRDSASRVVFDRSEAIYMVGSTFTGTHDDLLVAKYALDGTILWQRFFSAPGASNDSPVALRPTADGGVLVLAHVFDAAAGFERDVVLVKFDAAGNQLWSRVFSETAISDEEISGFDLDASGNIYVSGTVVESTNPELPHHLFTLKCTSAGSVVYFVKGGMSGGFIAIGPDGNPVVSGMSFGGGGSNVITSLSKLDAGTGGILWTVPTTAAGRVAVDIDGSIYLAGTRAIMTSSTPYDYFTAHYNAAGLERWTRIVTAGDRVTDVHLDPAGNFYVTGSGPGVRDDIVTVRYTDDFVPPPPVALPAAPSALKLSAAKSKLTLTWTDHATNESGFKIERSINGGAFVQIAQVGANVKTFANTGLSKSNTYAYRVRAFNGSGNSAFSNTATGKPK